MTNPELDQEHIFCRVDNDADTTSPVDPVANKKQGAHGDLKWKESGDAPRENKATTATHARAVTSTHVKNGGKKPRKNRQSTPDSANSATLAKAKTVDQFAGSTIQDKTNNTAKNKCTASTKSCPVQILWSSDEKTMESNKENVKDASKTKTDNT